MSSYVEIKAGLREGLVQLGRALAEESQKFGELPPMTLKNVIMYRKAYQAMKG